MAYNYLQDMPRGGSMDSFLGGYDVGQKYRQNQIVKDDNKALADILRGDTNAITRLQSPDLIQKAQNHLRELEQRKALQGFYTPATKDQYQANVTQNPIAAIMDGGKKPSNLVQAQQPSFQESQAPTMLDMLQTGKIASGKPASYDVEGAGNYLLGQANFDQLGRLTDYRKAIAKDEAEWGTNPTKGINPTTMKPDSYITNRLGEVRWLGSGVYESPKDGKAVPVMENGRPKTVKVPNTNEVKILMSDGTLMSGGSIPTLKPEKNADHPVYFNTTLTGDDFLKTLSPVDQAHVKALNEGREPFPTAKMMASNPYYERLADAVAQYNPDFDATAYNTRKTASAAFTTGIQGRQLLAFGSAVKHLETLGSLIDALENKDTVQLNRLNNVWKTQTGQTAVTNFESAKGIVAKEIMKSIVTGGGGVEERQELARLMDTAKSPQQLRGVVDTYHELMSAQKENLIIQRDAAGLPRSTLPDYTMPSADDKGEGGKDPYKITKGMNPRRAKYLTNHKALVDAGDYEGAKMLTDIYKRGAK